MLMKYMTNTNDHFAEGESVLITTFYMYGSQLVITNKRLIGRRHLKVGRAAFEGEIFLDTIVGLRYSRGFPLVGDPSLIIEYKLPDGSVAESCIRFQGGPAVHRASGHTPQQIYELLQDLMSQTVDGAGMRQPSSAMQQQLVETSKRASRLRGAVLMAAVFAISGGLTAVVCSLVTGETQLTDVVSILSRLDWVGMLGLLNIILFSFVFLALMAAIAIYFLVDDSYLDFRWTVRWAVVGVVYALLWQLGSSLFRHFDVPATCLMDILLRVPIAGLAYLLVFRLFTRMRTTK